MAQEPLLLHLAINLPDGTLVGTGGPQATNIQYLAKSDTQGNVTAIARFPSSNEGSDSPAGSVTYGTDANFYGVAQGQTGSQAYSYIYPITPAGAFARFYNFGANCFGSYGAFYPVVQSTDGNFYGVSALCGTNGYGAFYKVTPSGQYTLLYGALPRHGATSSPQFLIQASDGNFYGATLGSGGDSAIFQMTPSGQFTLIHNMRLGDGQCPCELTQGSDGIIYGIAENGGPTGSGTFFAVGFGSPGARAAGPSVLPAIPHAPR